MIKSIGLNNFYLKFTFNKGLILDKVFTFLNKKNQSLCIVIFWKNIKEINEKMIWNKFLKINEHFRLW